jgi:hypothetical protein
MLTITVADLAGQAGAGQICFHHHRDATVAELHIGCHTSGHSSTVLLDHHAAVWLMASLGVFATAHPAAQLDEIPARDSDGHQHSAAVQFDQHTGLLHVTNHSQASQATVRLDPPAATTLMAHLGAFVATT